MSEVLCDAHTDRYMSHYTHSLCVTSHIFNIHLTTCFASLQSPGEEVLSGSPLVPGGATSAGSGAKQEAALWGELRGRPGRAEHQWSLGARPRTLSGPPGLSEKNASPIHGSLLRWRPGVKDRPDVVSWFQDTPMQ